MNSTSVAYSSGAKVSSPRQSVASTPTSSFSSDDYGEEDVSLQSYRTSRQDAGSTHEHHEGVLAREETKKMLLQCLRKLDSTSGMHLQVSETTGRCCFETANGRHKIELSIREDDPDTVIISTVVYKTNQGDDRTAGQRRESQPTQGSYSLMTKMMKFNAQLSRRSVTAGGTAAQNGAAGRVSCHGGVFVFFLHMDIMNLCIEGRVKTVLEDIMLQAAEMSKEFVMAQDVLADKGKRLRRRRRLIGAYNRATKAL